MESSPYANLSIDEIKQLWGKVIQAELSQGKSHEDIFARFQKIGLTPNQIDILIKSNSSEQTNKSEVNNYKISLAGHCLQSAASNLKSYVLLMPIIIFCPLLMFLFPQKDILMLTVIIGSIEIILLLTSLVFLYHTASELAEAGETFIQFKSESKNKSR